jgi:hypothetical protein
MSVCYCYHSAVKSRAYHAVADVWSCVNYKYMRIVFSRSLRGDITLFQCEDHYRGLVNTELQLLTYQKQIVFKRSQEE